MFFMKKKGISGIITMLIIIALVLVAVGVVWVVINNILETSEEEVSSGLEDLLENPLRIGEEEEEEDCTPESTEMTCGVWVCGAKANNCGQDVDCGTCDSGTCEEGVCVGCIPDCTGKECGDDGCGENENCGSCSEGNCIEGTCVIEEYVNSGVVDLVWPPGVGLYFDSDDLSKEISYINYYVKFPEGAESRCLIIYDYIFPALPEIYNKSHIRLGVSHSDIQSSDNYEIWGTYAGCSS